MPYGNITWLPTTTATTTTSLTAHANNTNASAIFPALNDQNQTGETGPDYIFHHSVVRELEACLEPAMIALHRYDAQRERRRRRRAARQDQNYQRPGMHVDVDTDMDVPSASEPGISRQAAFHSSTNGYTNVAPNGHHRHQQKNDDDFSDTETETDSHGTPTERVIYVSPSGVPFTRNMLARYRRGILRQAEVDAEADPEAEGGEGGTDDWDGGGEEDRSGGRVFFEPEFIEDPFAVLARARMGSSSV